MTFPSRSRALACALIVFVGIFEVTCFVPQKRVPRLAVGLEVASYSTNARNTKPARPRVHRGRLHRVIRSIEYYGKVEGDEQRPSDVLLNAMRMLLDAKTDDSIAHVGKMLDNIDVVNRECLPIQERVVTATSIAGLVSNSMHILKNMLHSSYLPSSKAYVAACSALRQSGRLHELERFMYDLAELGKKLDAPVDVVAWNIYLSSQCSSIDKPDNPAFARLLEWLDPDEAQRLFHVTPDVTSFNILLDTAARVGNNTLMEILWQDLEARRDIEPDIVSHNARLKASTTTAERLEILEEIESFCIAPDAFTIDLLSNDLIEAGRFEDLQCMVDQVLSGKTESQKKKTLGAFLVTLVQQENVESARVLFERCALDEAAISCVSPCTRHFNVLLDGYSKAAKLWTNNDQLLLMQETLRHESAALDYLDFGIDPTKFSALIEGRKLYRKMVSLGVEQDPYSLSSMISLCISSDEVIQLMNDSTVPLSPAVVRSAITHLGHLRSPSQACRVFDQYAYQPHNNRVWNVLLGALSEGARQDNMALEMDSTIPGKRNLRGRKGRKGGKGNQGISSLVDGLTCAGAARAVLCAMNGMEDGVMAPKPDSQSYCLVAAALQFESTDPSIAMELFRNATNDGIPADGRFVNAVLRCFGGNIQDALASWKEEIRNACVEHEARTRTRAVASSRPSQKNLIAAYTGLLYVCGRAIRPDIAVRVSHAMRKEGIEPNEIALNCYNAGKRLQEELNEKDEKTWQGQRLWPKFLPQPNMIEQYESLLYVECTKYDPGNNRMAKERRLRIIL